MYIPLALGTLIALLIAPRKMFWHLLAAAFVSAAVAKAAPQLYWMFAPAWIVAAALRTVAAERPAVAGLFLLILAGILVWASDNTVVAQALAAFAAAIAHVMLKVFEAVGAAVGLAGALGSAAGAALAWTYFARRLERAAEEVPFAVMAPVMLGWVMVSAVVRGAGMAASQYSDVTATAFGAAAVAAAFISLYRIYEALKGDMEAAVDAAVGAPFLAAAFPDLWRAVAPVIAAFVILDTALSAWQRRLGVTAIALAVALAHAGA
jgi:hypothetical protein